MPMWVWCAINDRPVIATYLGYILDGLPIFHNGIEQ